MIRLPGVTVLAATSVSIDATAEALGVCASQIEFAAVKLLAPVRPAALPAGVEHVAIAPMDLPGYSKFILGALHRHFETSHCLVVQADGFVLNPTLWREEFLSYDYIGAPWPEEVQVNPGAWRLRLNRNRVGNGGFSLRSHRLMSMAAQIDFDRLDFPVRSEDLVLCHYLYDQLRAKGVSYAPVELATCFAMEPYNRGQRLDAVFGFHGRPLLQEVVRRFPDTTLREVRALLGQPVTISGPPPGRNEPCPCGSGKRFKHCHGRISP